MISLVACKNNIRSTGFTLIELLLVMALMTSIGVFMAPVGISFYQTQLINDASDGITSVLRQAQIFSMTNKNESNFGVAFNESAYVLFQGDTYENRVVDEDLTFPVSDTIVVDAPAEVVFATFSGEPSTTTVISLVLNEKERAIEIMSSGNIDR